MTPKEKAKEMLKTFDNIPRYAKKAVDEILEAINGMVDEEIGYSADEYYLKVKQEINLL